MILVLDSLQFSRNLRYLREKNNYSIKTLAEKAGCDPAVIHSLEDGTLMDLEYRILKNLSTIFSTSVEGILDCDLESGKIEVTVVPPYDFHK